MPHDGTISNQPAAAGATAGVARGRAQPAARPWFDKVHRWLGFTCGAILIIAGLTGTLLSFYIEVERTLYPSMQTRAHAEPSSFEDIFARLSELPVDGPGYWRIEVPPAGTGGPVTSRFNSTADDGAPTRMVTLDPDSLEVRRDAHWGETFFTWIYDVHQNLLMGPPGKIVMSVAAVLMIVMLVTGVCNWLLIKGGLSAKLSFKRGANAARRTFDIHKLTGLVALLLLLAVGTAPLISLPKQVHPVLELFAPLKQEPDVASTPAPGASRMPVDRAIAIGEAEIPGARVVWVRVPATATDPYDLTMRQAGAPLTRFPRTHLWIDQYSGSVLAVKDPRTDTASDTVLNWLVPIHDGKAFGFAGRVLVAILGVLPLVLFVTGLLRWLQKRAIRLKAQRRTATPRPSN